MLVIDASLAVELALDRVGEVLGDDRLVAPPLLWSDRAWPRQRQRLGQLAHSRF